MDAKLICENVLYHLKTSGLNYTLTETPFSVNIILKKSLIKDKCGAAISSPFPNNESRAQVIMNTRQVKNNTSHIKLPVNITTSTSSQSKSSSSPTNKVRNIPSPTSLLDSSSPCNRFKYDSFPSRRFTETSPISKFKENTSLPPSYQTIQQRNPSYQLENPIFQSKEPSHTTSQLKNPSFPTSKFQQNTYPTSQPNDTIQHITKVMNNLDSKISSTMTNSVPSCPTNPKQTDYFPPSLALVKKRTLDSRLQKNSSTSPNFSPPPTLNSSKQSSHHEASSWKFFPFKTHPEVLESDSDDTSDEENIEEFLKKMKWLRLEMKPRCQRSLDKT